MTEKLFCMNCGRSMLEDEIFEQSSVISVVKFIGRMLLTILNMALLGLPIMRKKKSRATKKKKCDYCDSDLIFPDTSENREFAKSFAKKI